MDSKNIFTGKWRIAALYANVVGQGWTLFKEYEPDEFTWGFTESLRLTFPAGTFVYSGKMLEQIKDGKDFLTEFSYFAEDRQLYIDRSDYAEDGFCNICINDRYRVEQISPAELWLYDLEDVEKEPEDYRFRIKAIKY